MGIASLQGQGERTMKVSELRKSLSLCKDDYEVVVVKGRGVGTREIVHVDLGAVVNKKLYNPRDPISDKEQITLLLITE